MFYLNFKNFIKLFIFCLKGKFFWNYRLYEKYHEDVQIEGGLQLNNKKKFAIVMQGLMVDKDLFTVNTMEIYRKNFPDAILILSTWDVSSMAASRMSLIDVHVIYNNRPNNSGISNINLQIVTSKSGVLKAKDMGAEYVLKTRTDQRIYHPSLYVYLFSLIDIYPLPSHIKGQNKRLVAASLNTFKYRLYGVSDMFLFGEIDDMTRYWNAPLDERHPSFGQESGKTLREFSEYRIAEVYLSTEFLKKIGRNIDFSLKDSFSIFRDHFIVIDQSAVKLFWNKYTFNEEKTERFGQFNPEMSHNDWLLLHSSMNSLLIDESILDRSN